MVSNQILLVKFLKELKIDLGVFLIFINFLELLDYLKTVLEDNNKQSGSLLRFSSHLSLFFKSASFELKVNQSLFSFKYFAN